MTRKHILVVLAGLALVGTSFGCITSAALSGTASSEIVSERVLNLEAARDVRWWTDESLVVTDLRRGLAVIDLESPDKQPLWLPGWPRASRVGTRYAHLGVSDDRVVVGDLAFGVQWRRRTEPAETAPHRETIEYVADLDVQGDRLLVSGLQRGETGDLGADESVAWTGSLEDPELSLRPVLPFRSRASIENCAGMPLGAVRFLSDGRYVVVPGSEPGIYLYGADERLERVWKSSAVGVEVDCDLSEDQQSLLSSNPSARQEWINRRRTIDDVVDLNGEPAVILRDYKEGRVTWQIATFIDDEPEIRPLPISDTSPAAHLAADARGGLLAVLISNSIPLREPTPARLLVMSLGE